MRITRLYLVAVVFLALSAVTAWSQTATVKGVVTDSGKPLPGAHVSLTNLANGQHYTVKAGSDGSFILVGVQRGNYQVEVTGAKGEKLFQQKTTIAPPGDDVAQLPLEVSSGSTMSNEQREAIKAQNAKAESVNALIKQAQDAMAQKNWQAAEGVLQQLTAADPSQYQFHEALGNTEYNLGKYDAAVAAFEKGIQAAENTKPDSKKPATDPAKVKAAMGEMLTQEGNAYIKLHKSPEGIAAYTKAASMSPNPGAAYFNLCATQYNTGNTDGAIAACDKAIAADPNKADAYFIKGSLMAGQGKQDKSGKYIVPEGTAEALNKYLELAPDGPHANDVKAMLQMIGAKIETTYKAGKKK